MILSQHGLPLARSAQLWKQLEISLLGEEEGEVEKEVGGIEVRKVMRRGGGYLHCFVRPGRNCRCSWNISGVSSKFPTFRKLQIVLATS